MVEILLFILMSAVLLTVVSLAWLSRRVPKGTPEHSELFSAGDIPPYNFAVSLKARFLLPWVAAPELSAYGTAATALLLARAGAMLAIAVLIAMVALGFANVWA